MRNIDSMSPDEIQAYHEGFEEGYSKGYSQGHTKGFEKAEQKGLLDYPDRVNKGLSKGSIHR